MVINCEKFNCTGVEVKKTSIIHSQVAKELFPDRVADDFLLLALQQFERELNNCSSVEFTKEEFPDQVTDDILLLASQQFEGKQSLLRHLTDGGPQPTLFEEGSKNETVSETSGVVNRGSVRYGSPKTSKEVEEARKRGIPVKTQDQNKWVGNIWHEWVQYRLQCSCVDPEEKEHKLLEDFCKMSKQAMNFWLGKFVLEVRRKDGRPYSPDTLYQICCALLRLLREVDRADVNILADPMFCQFRATLDAHMKELKSTGNYQVKKAEILTEEHEDTLWKQGLLGDKHPQQLLNTLIYYIGFYFALRSGVEHRRLRYYPSQIQLFEPTNGRAYVMYTEDVSKANQGGLVHRRWEQKQVVQYANDDNPERCLVRLYKLYMSKCPEDRPDGALYLKPLAKPTEQCWYHKIPIGHNSLQQTVCRLCVAAGIEGKFTNHSLRTTNATRLFEAKVDEQLIMQRTGHSSNAVRAYKRVGEKLRTVTSDVLNGTVTTTKDQDLKVSPDEKFKQHDKPDKTENQENMASGINLVGATNCTININYHH